MIFSNSSTSVPFQALRSPSGVTFPVPACFLAAVLVPVGQTHVPLLAMDTLGCPELTTKHKYQSAVGRMRCASLLPENHPGMPCTGMYNRRRWSRAVQGADLGLGRPDLRV